MRETEKTKRAPGPGVRGQGVSDRKVSVGLLPILLEEKKLHITAVAISHDDKI